MGSTYFSIATTKFSTLGLSIAKAKPCIAKTDSQIPSTWFRIAKTRFCVPGKQDPDL